MIDGTPEFAEILAKAVSVFGTREAAETWMSLPAVGLDRRRPLDLLATPEGRGLVVEHLTRLEHGIYT